MRSVWAIIAVAVPGVAATADRLCADDPPAVSAANKPPWQRLLQDADASKADRLDAQIAELTELGQFEEALKQAVELAELRGKLQGAKHWQAVNARWKADALRQVLRGGNDTRDFATLGLLNRMGFDYYAKFRFRDAQSMYERAVAVCRKDLGEDYPDTATGYRNLAIICVARSRYAEAEVGFKKALAIRRKTLGDDHPDTATSYHDLAANLNGQGIYAEAAVGFNKALAIRRKTLGEDHPQTAVSYSSVAHTLAIQGKYAEAEEGFTKALVIRRKALGDNHADTAASYNDLAANLNARGKHTEAEAGFRKALAIRHKTLGDDNALTAASYTNLAANLRAQGKVAEAEEGFQKALAICRKTLGEDHPQTAACYNNVAQNLGARGKYAEAEEGFKKALAIRRKSLGEVHPATAASYDNLAENLAARRKYAEAEEGFTKALAIRRKTLGEEHPVTATSYDNVALNLNAQGKYAEAEKEFRKALAIRRSKLGDDHFGTARSYNNVAFNLEARGQYAEAEVGFKKALAIFLRTLGEGHPTTAAIYNNLAHNLDCQGKYTEAEVYWKLAADCFERARPGIARSGLDRATKTAERSPLPALAAVLARNGKREEAWRRYEASLAPGTRDDIAVRLRRLPSELAKQAEFVARVERLDQLVDKATTLGEPSEEQKERSDDLLAQRRQIQDELDAFTRQLEEKYGPTVGQVFERKLIQASLPDDAALVGWLDIAGAPAAADPDGEHWAFVLRSTGEPAVIRLPGTGPGGHWTGDDVKLSSELRAAVQAASGTWQPLAERLREQRFDPLAEYLSARDGRPAVRHIIVLPSTALAGLPAEAFIKGYTLSYALSGTLYAHLRKQSKVQTAGLLALADPIFDRPTTSEPARPLMPPGGLLVTSVVPGGNAAQAGLKAGDVLLHYNGTALAARTDLRALPESEDSEQQIPVTVWRHGKTLEKKLRPGKLGAVIANDPAPQALAARYEGDRLVAKLRGGNDGDWPALPGTRVEAEGLHRLFAGPGAEPLVLSGSEASEQRLYELAKSGDLGKYRYLHLATHGTVDDRFALRSALILSRDHLPDPDKQLDAGLPVFDGRLTAEKVLRQWHLNADLVTLSACQTALGKYERGEGFVGFAQALILAGSRSVCLSLWKVDDTATALLMGRFYANLLGKREGLKGPMPKAEALAEAKAWLRGLTREEAAQRAAKMSDGVARGKRPKLPPATMPEAEAKRKAKASVEADRPYAHPYYWAAFVLIGDPD